MNCLRGKPGMGVPGLNNKQSHNLLGVTVTSLLCHVLISLFYILFHVHPPRKLAKYKYQVLPVAGQKITH